MREDDRKKLDEVLRTIDPTTWKIGRYRGRYMRELPGKYLCWALLHMKLSMELKVRILDEIRRRLA